MLINVSMFYSVLAAADDGRRPWAHPATHTHTPKPCLSHKTHKITRWWCIINGCTGVIEKKKNPRDGAKNGCRVGNTMSTKVNVFNSNISFNLCQNSFESDVVSKENVARFRYYFRATWDTTSLCKRLAHTDAAHTGFYPSPPTVQNGHQRLSCLSSCHHGAF